MAASRGADVEAQASGIDASARSSLSHRRSDSIVRLDDDVASWRLSGDDDGKPESEHEPLMDASGPEAYELQDCSRPAKAPEDDEDEDSPYAEVRAAVRNYDEDVPCSAVRAWSIGMSLVFVGASMNTLFSLRQPSISIGALVAQIMAWPIGHGWARVMPDWHFSTLGRSWRLNPEPFTIKEHAVIGVMASVTFSVAYSTDIILAQFVFYKQNFGLAFQLLLTISTQSLGYGIAGSMRKFLSWPPRGPVFACLG